MISGDTGPAAPRGRRRSGAGGALRRRCHDGLLLIAILAVAACSNTAGIAPSSAPSAPGQAGAENRPVLTQFSDIYVPPDAKIYVEKTLVFGSSPWYGRLSLGASQDSNNVFDLYRRDMPGLGWQEITSIRAPISILTYTRENRVMTIQIQRTTLGGSEITLTSSPRDSGQGSNASPSYPPAQAPGYAAPQAPVTRVR